jgi:hypothetical protein
MNVKRFTGKALIGLGLVAAIAVAAISASPQSVNQQVARANAPDLILYNGKISTLDGEGSVVKAIAIRDEVIIATDDQSGRIRALAGKDTEVVNLNGRRVLPGLIDGHLHGMREGYHCWTQVVRLDLVTSRAQALAMYAAKAIELDDGRWIWTTAGGWNVNQLDVRRSSRSPSSTRRRPRTRSGSQAAASPVPASTRPRSTRSGSRPDPRASSSTRAASRPVSWSHRRPPWPTRRSSPSSTRSA